MGTTSDSNGGGSGVRGLVLKAFVLLGGTLVLKRLTKSATRRDHARIVAQSLTGEKFSREQASRDPDSYFNLRMLTCPVTEMVDGSRVLYSEQAFWRTPQKPFRQRFYMVRPCPKEMKCDVELSSFAIRDAEEYKNLCDRPKDQRPQDEEVIARLIFFLKFGDPSLLIFCQGTQYRAIPDIAEHLTVIHLSRCERGFCLYEGSTPPGGYPNYWNGAAYCTSELVVYKNCEIHTCDRGYDDEGNQVWGVKDRPYEFKPASAPASSFGDMFSSLNLPPKVPVEKKMQDSSIEEE